MRTLLLGPPWGDIYGDFKQAAKVGVNYPPLGLCYLASAWLTPRRVIYNLRRAGPKAGLQNSWAFFRSFILPPKRAEKSRVSFLTEITDIADRLEGEPVK